MLAGPLSGDGKVMGPLFSDLLKAGSGQLRQCARQRLQHARCLRWRQVDDRELGACRAEGCGRLRRVASELHLAGQQNLRRVATGIRAVLVKHVPRPAELPGRAAAEVPVLGEAGRRAQRALLAAAAMQIGGCGCCTGSGLHRASVSS